MRDLGGRVGGAGDGRALPGEEEDDAAVGGGRVEEPHVGGGVVVREDDVDARRGAHDVGHLLDRVQWSEFDSVCDDVWVCDDIWA